MAMCLLMELILISNCSFCICILFINNLKSLFLEKKVIIIIVIKKNTNMGGVDHVTL